MSQPFVGEIKAVGFSYAPRGYAFAGGQLLPINQNSALFSLIGTNFGGDGVTTFGLPNLKGRLAIGQGQSNGTSNYALGQAGGSESVTLNGQQLPTHTHLAATTVTPDASSLQAATAINALTAPTATVAIPTGNMLTVGTTGGATPVALKPYAAPASGTQVAMASAMASTTLSGSVTATAATTVQPVGGSQPFGIMQPFLAVTYIIATDGIFPSRN